MDFLFWLVVGILLIFAISRYNESNKIFWTFTTAFLLGITCATAVNSCTSKKSKQCSVQTSPMQVSDVSMGDFIIPVTIDYLPIAVTKVTVSVPAGKDNLFALKGASHAQSKVCGGARDQPFNYFDTS